jgi:hypothetical protein
MSRARESCQDLRLAAFLYVTEPGIVRAALFLSKEGMHAILQTISIITTLSDNSNTILGTPLTEIQCPVLIQWYFISWKVYIQLRYLAHKIARGFALRGGRNSK